MSQKVVYRLYSADGELLYIGCTNGLKARLANHRLSSAWWPDVAAVEVDGPFEWAEGHTVEISLIHMLAPLHNKVWNKRRGWDYGRGPASLQYFPHRDEFARAA